MVRRAARSSSQARRIRLLDGALVSDGESLRVITQIFETLVALKPGTTEPEPGLAESWEANEDGTVWTFKIRQGVTFHDGETLDAEAVCFNFDRWYNFKGACQPGRELLLAGRLRRLRRVRPGQRRSGGEPLQELRGDRRVDGRADADEAVGDVHPGALAAVVLDREPEGADGRQRRRGHRRRRGRLHSGTFGTENPAGTGPFKFESWVRNERLTLTRYDDYWGDKAKIDELIIRPIADNAARLQALQTGEIQGYDLVEPQDIATIEGDENLQIIDRPAFNVAYVGFNIAKKPTDDIKVREAIAYGLDRQAVVDNFYSGRGVVATQFMPPEVVGYADDVTTYEYDPEKAKQILTDAGYTLPVALEFWYPTDVSRPYMPDPKRNFEAFAASLNKSGFKVTPKSAPWNPDYLGRVDAGNAGNARLLGWTGDYGDADNFIGTFFQSPQKAWGRRRRR